MLFMKKSNKIILIDDFKFQMIGYVIKNGNPKLLVIRTGVKGQLSRFKRSYDDIFEIKVDDNLKFRVKCHPVFRSGIIETYYFAIVETIDKRLH